MAESVRLHLLHQLGQKIGFGLGLTLTQSDDKNHEDGFRKQDRQLRSSCKHKVNNPCDLTASRATVFVHYFPLVRKCAQGSANTQHLYKYGGMCLQVINCNFTHASNNEELLLDEGCCSPTASLLPVFFSLFDCVVSLHSGFSIVHQYIQRFNEVSGNKSGKIPPCVCMCVCVRTTCFTCSSPV